MRPKVNTNLVNLEGPWTARRMGTSFRALGIVDAGGEPSIECKRITFFLPATGEEIHTYPSPVLEHIDARGHRYDVLAIRGKQARTRHLVTKDRALKIDEPFRIGSELFLPVRDWLREQELDETESNALYRTGRAILGVHLEHVILNATLDRDDIDETTGKPRLCYFPEPGAWLRIVTETFTVRTERGRIAEAIANVINDGQPEFLHVNPTQADRIRQVLDGIGAIR